MPLFLVPWIAVFAVFSWACQRFLLELFTKINFLDLPDSKLKQHKNPVPLSGGIALVAALLVPIFFGHYSFCEQWRQLPSPTILVLLPFFFLGLVDDIFNIDQKIKFAIQFLLTLGAFIFLRIPLHWVQVVVSLLIINAFNLIDVLDGLCGVTAFFAAVNFAVLAYLLQFPAGAIYFALLAIALLGFLAFNWPPAKCYLGDAGSTFLGASFALLPLLFPWPDRTTGMLSILTACAIPCAEVLMLVVIRSYLKIPPYRGSRHHFAHFLTAQGWSNKKILGFVAAIGAETILLTTILVSNLLPLALWVAMTIPLFFAWLLVIYL